MASEYKEKAKVILESQGKDVKEVESSFIVKGITLLTTGSSREKEPLMDIFWKQIVEDYEKEHYKALKAPGSNSDGNESVAANENDRTKYNN